MAEKTYKIVVDVVYTLSIPVDCDNEDDAIKAVEKILLKHDNYEIVNRASNRAIEIKEIKETYGK